jgi:hypothetical protein
VSEVGREGEEGSRRWQAGTDDLGPEALDGLGGKPQLHMAVALQ